MTYGEDYPIQTCPSCDTLVNRFVNPDRCPSCRHDFACDMCTKSRADHTDEYGRWVACIEGIAATRAANAALGLADDGRHPR